MNSARRLALVLTLAALTYFVMFPEDAQDVARPVATFANLTTAVSPWFYGVAATAIIAFGMFKTWGDRTGQ